MSVLPAKPTDVCDQASASSSSLLLWRTETTRQASQKERAEQENRMLRSLLKGQAGIAKSLKRMLRKRLVSQE